ncbi:hypothetical protein DV495_003797 [Geotrichum candidum]|nr:hypothetical protein DV495_003797 [Geotrichum candidum]KAF7499840.1 hypothetical protein DV113_002124 [Geotrichum candidum]KAI8132687.1 hypothetical protein DUD61_003645 [Geotrichum candidum]KAI9213915.1 hypothetical protein DS838_001244 [Geotrichum bryndzae]
MLRNGVTGDWIGTFLGHKGAIWCSRISEFGDLAVTGSADFTANVWNVSNGQPIISVKHGHIVRSADLVVASGSRTGRLVTGGQDKLVKVWSFPSGEKELEWDMGSPVRSTIWISSTVRLDYDISGRSIGTAIANFNSPYEAEEAVRRFNGRKAAGVIISVELYYHNSDRRAPRYDSRGGASSSHRRREPQPRRGNDDRDRSDAKPFRRGERAPRKAKKTLEELDAELTSYMNGGSGDAPDTETSNTTSHHDNNEPSSNDHSNDNNNSSIQPNNSSNFGDSNASSTAAESSNDQHPPAHKDDDEMVLD